MHQILVHTTEKVAVSWANNIIEVNHVFQGLNISNIADTGETGFLESIEGQRQRPMLKVSQFQSFHFRSRSCTPPPGSTVNPACISLVPVPPPPPAPTVPPLPPSRQAPPRLGFLLLATPEAAPSVSSNPCCDCAPLFDGTVLPSAPTAAAAAAASFGGSSVAAAAGEKSRAAQMRARSIRSATPANGRPTQPRGPDA